VNVSDLMHAIYYSYNAFHLRAKLKSNSTEFFTQFFADLPLHEHKPLDITGDDTGKTLSSYKHPWDKAKALLKFGKDLTSFGYLLACKKLLER